VASEDWEGEGKVYKKGWKEGVLRMELESQPLRNQKEKHQEAQSPRAKRRKEGSEGKQKCKKLTPR